MPLALSPDGEFVDIRRSRCAAQFCRLAGLGTRRLATTVTALETIRLGLLRLQIGAVPVATVTQAIEAAALIGREVEYAADARREVLAALRPRE
jgi:hypothetical protein